ncbi:plancitoxin-1-like [Gigantopelta aegis]|uniref:plancitoxin-1-like n=1 Tax=Gigantopelta aegis TaxID=1735272 RepID=UPI001B88DE1B|nr:plancitoxin-1-like [Gigantopelta aegis]
MASLKSLLILSFLFCAGLHLSCLALQCIDPNGKPVDWFIVYKLPKLPGNKSNPILRDGLGHFYMDVNTPQWKLSNISMACSKHAIYNTLQQIYSSKLSDGILYLMYNDEDPKGRPYLSSGHTKGVISFDKHTGFWLVHSTPRFPPFKQDGYSWPESAKDFGQNFLCVTYNYKMLNTIGSMLVYNHPKFYDLNYTNDYLHDNPSLRDALQGTQLQVPPWTNKEELISSRGTKFVGFAKSRCFHKDLYEDYVAPTLKGDLFVETWRSNEPQGLASNCSKKYKVYNADFIKLPNGINFKETKDHSKWAVSQNATYWVCIGDINRQCHQEKRGGGTVCLQDKMVWQAYNDAVGGIVQCPQKAAPCVLKRKLHC